VGSKIDWPAYTKQRKNELETFLHAALDVASKVGPPRPEPAPAGSRGRGRPPRYTSTGMLVVNLVRMHLRMSYRDLESYLRSHADLRHRLGLDRPPTPTTIHRHAQALTESYLERFNQALTERLKKTSHAPPSTPRVSRSRGTRDVGALPRTRSAS
jgi:hypothetical protein